MSIRIYSNRPQRAGAVASDPVQPIGRDRHPFETSQPDAERVGIDELEGRITTSLLTPYPPGIPLLIPGERFNKKIVDYLKFTRSFNAKFPGFATDVHGLVHEIDEETGRGFYYVDCVKS